MDPNRTDFFKPSIVFIRGDFIVPNFEEIWPSGKKKNNKEGGLDSKMDYILSAMKTGIPGARNINFTTVGKPKVSHVFMIFFFTKNHFFFFKGHRQSIRQSYQMLL